MAYSSIDMENKIIPEYQIVKYEMLEDFFKIKDLMEKALRKQTPHLIGDIKAKMLIFYVTLRTKRANKSKELKKGLQELEDAVVKCRPLNDDLNSLFALFTVIQQLLDVMGLTQIHYSSQSPKDAYKY